MYPFDIHLQHINQQPLFEQFKYGVRLIDDKSKENIYLKIGLI